MKIDTFCPLTSWDDLEREAALADAHGFDGFALPEITGDPFIHAAIAARASERVQVRTAIAVAFPRSPMVVANQAWSIHVNSGGRFALGLGTQIKAHNERRFSVPWKAPIARMTEYVESLRAIWRCWELGERLRYEGEHYNFSLMTPEFSPPPSKLPMVPVYLAAVRPKMIEAASKVADGLRLHGFCTRRYLEEVVSPAIGRGLTSAGRSRASLEVCGGGFIMTGPDEETVAKNREWARYRVAFYGSTPGYRPVMSLHGWDDLAEKLHAMTRAGKWKEMAAEVPDDVLDAFALCTTYEGLASAIEARFGGVSDTVEVGFEPGTDPALAGEILADVRAIDAAFEAHIDRYAIEASGCGSQKPGS